MKSMLLILFAVVLVPLSLNSCLVERTVTDGGGNVIYEEAEVHGPFESEQQKEQEVEKKESELGW